MLNREHSFRIASAVAAVVMVFLVGSPAQAVDGVLEINQTCGVQTGCFPGDGPGFPVTISEKGSYILTSNLSVTDPDSTAIESTASGVTIDLNGFSVNGPVLCEGFGASVTCSPSGTGSGIVGSITTTVKNGGVGAFASDGVSISTSSRVIQVHSARNAGSGIVVGMGSLVIESSGSRNFASGIVMGDTCVASGNRSRHNRLDGIVAGDYSNVKGNMAARNAGFGLNATSTLVSYWGNVFGDNNGGDANPQTNAGADLGQNLCGLRTACP